MKKINFKNFKINNAPRPDMTGNNNGSPDDSVDAMRYAVDNMKYRKNRPLAYKIYTYLKENAVGYDNRIKSNELMRMKLNKYEKDIYESIMEVTNENN